MLAHELARRDSAGHHLAMKMMDALPDVIASEAQLDTLYAAARQASMPDRRGSNRIDSLRNIVNDPRVALLFLIPGCDESLRVNGRGTFSCNADLLAGFGVGERLPTTVLLIQEEVAGRASDDRRRDDPVGERSKSATRVAFRTDFTVSSACRRCALPPPSAVTPTAPPHAVTAWPCATGPA